MMSWCMLPAFDYTICQMGGFDSLPVASLHIPQESSSGIQAANHPPTSDQPADYSDPHQHDYYTYLTTTLSASQRRLFLVPHASGCRKR
jgi:hypothetical protein